MDTEKRGGGTLARLADALMRIADEMRKSARLSSERAGRRSGYADGSSNKGRGPTQDRTDPAVPPPSTTSGEDTPGGGSR